MRVATKVSPVNHFRRGPTAKQQCLALRATRTDAKMLAVPPFISAALSMTLFVGAAYAIDPCCEDGLTRCRENIGRDESCRWDNPLACVRNARRAVERAACDKAWKGDCSEACCNLGTCPGDTTIPLPGISTGSIVFAPPLCDNQ